MRSNCRSSGHDTAHVADRKDRKGYIVRKETLFIVASFVLISAIAVIMGAAIGQELVQGCAGIEPMRTRVTPPPTPTPVCEVFLPNVLGYYKHFPPGE